MHCAMYGHRLGHSEEANYTASSGAVCWDVKASKWADSRPWLLMPLLWCGGETTDAHCLSCWLLRWVSYARGPNPNFSKAIVTLCCYIGRKFDTVPQLYPAYLTIRHVLHLYFWSLHPSIHPSVLSAVYFHSLSFFFCYLSHFLQEI